jgi:hypothetical protein
MKKRHHTKEMVNYDPDTPRCGNCKRYIKGLPKLKTSDVVFPQLCGLIGYQITAVGLCDMWLGKSGEVLEMRG